MEPTFDDEATEIITPVVLLPGLARHDWMLLRRHLERAGFAHVVEIRDLPAHSDIARLADHLARHVDAVRALAGSATVHLVGHHLGGIVARYYLQVLDGAVATTALITVATPHGGTDAAPLGMGPAAAQIRRGSRVMRRLEASARPTPVRFINYFADRDVLVPPSSAVVRQPMLRATNVLVPDHPHLSLVIAPGVCRSVAGQLAAIEGVAGFGTPVSGIGADGWRADFALTGADLVAANPPADVDAPKGREALMAAKARHPSSPYSLHSFAGHAFARTPRRHASVDRFHRS